MLLIDRISEIYKRMYHAAMRAGRDTQGVELVAVTKTIDSSHIQEAIDAGLRILGENRVQEAERKIGEIDNPNVKWHLIGHLQRNKAKAAVRLFDLIHSVDSAALLGQISRHAAAAQKVQRVLLQVKLSDEKSKHGIEEAELDALLEAAETMDAVRVEGLMTMTPYFDEPERARTYYRRLKELADARGLGELSMGMSGDFEIAIEEGATLVRVGSAIFGQRSNA